MPIIRTIPDIKKTVQNLRNGDSRFNIEDIARLQIMLYFDCGMNEKEPLYQDKTTWTY